MSLPLSTFVPMCKVLHPTQENGLCADGTKAKLLSAVFCSRIDWERRDEIFVCPRELEAVYHSVIYCTAKGCADLAVRMRSTADPNAQLQGTARGVTALLLPQRHSCSSLPFLFKRQASLSAAQERGNLFFQ